MTIYYSQIYVLREFWSVRTSKNKILYEINRNSYFIYLRISLFNLKKY